MKSHKSQDCHIIWLFTENSEILGNPVKVIFGKISGYAEMRLDGFILEWMKRVNA